MRENIRNRMVACKTATLVVTADNEYKENNYHVAMCKKELESLDLSVDIFDIDRQSAELLLDYDVVEFIGGNPFYLLKSIRENNADVVLREIVAKKILIGWSAAVFVFGPTLDLVNCYSPEMNFGGMSDLKGLALTQLEVLPHYSKFMGRINQFEEICCDYEKEHGVSVIRINDGEAVLVNEEEVRVY